LNPQQDSKAGRADAKEKGARVASAPKSSFYLETRPSDLVGNLSMPFGKPVRNS
jgi:hypothetical protein